MRRRKKKTNFSAIFIKKNHVLCSVVFTISILFICVPMIVSNTFKSDFLRVVLKSQLPILSNEIPNAKISFDKFFHLQNVLADVLPIIEKEPDLQTENTQIKEEIEPTPKNSFPIKNSPIISKNLGVKNETTYEPDFNSLLYAPLKFKSPEILIVHTHASESYKKDNTSYYFENESDRTTDINFNVVRVGNELEKELTRYGFKVTHAEDINDYPSYNKSYTKTLDVINYYLKQNKNIQIVIDIHRDSVIKTDGTKLKFLSEINGVKAAQVMIVCGTNQAGLENDIWQENLKFALKIQNFLENNYPGFARPLNLRQERFNTHATQGSMIIEVGSGGNTLDEALNSVKFLSNAINEVLKPYR